MLSIFDGDAEPYVGRRSPAFEERRHALGPFREDLILVMRRSRDHFEYALDEIKWYKLMEQIAH
jgi:hypothetical protein